VRRALVTGAGGTLGRALVAHLTAAVDWQVVATGRAFAKPDIEHLDVTCRESVVRAIAAAQPDVIFHLAASFSDDLDKAYDVNVRGIRNLLAALATTTGTARLLVMGSAAEYGLVRPEDNPITEDQALRPMTVYGLTKAWQTQLGLLHASQGADVVVARLFNLCADGMTERLFVGRVERQIAELLAGARARIEVGSLDAVRDYVSVADAVEQLLAIANCGSAGHVYNVGSGIPIKMRGLLSGMLAEHGLGMDVVAERRSSSSHHSYDVPIAYADMTRTGHLLEKWGQHASN
jgi:nucleoside-diphosphate-sugar epimerase